MSAWLNKTKPEKYVHDSLLKALNACSLKSADIDQNGLPLF